jgi:hypothetical protein
LSTYEIDRVTIPYFRLEDLLLLYTALPHEEQKLAGIVAKLRATRIDRKYLSLITDGNAALEDYVAKVLSAAD